MTQDIAQTIEAVLAQVRANREASKISVANQLSHLGSDAIAPLLDAMIAEQNTSARLALSVALPTYGHAAWQPILDAARANDGEGFGWTVAWATVRFKPFLEADDFIAALRHPNVHVRRASANALQKFADPRAIDPLIALLAENGPPTPRSPNDQHPHDYHKMVRWCAAQALHAIGVPAVPALLSAFQSASPLVRESAAQALKDVTGEHVFEALLTAARATDTKVRLAAYEALTSLLPTARNDQREQALPLLLNALHEHEFKPLYAAAQGLAALGPLALDALCERIVSREAVVDADTVQVGAAYALDLMLKRQPPDPEVMHRVVLPLIEVLGTAGSLVARRIAAEALGKASDRKAVAPLSSIVRSNPDPYVSMAAAESLQALGDTSALPALREALAAADAVVLRDGEDVSEADEDLQWVLRQAIETLEKL
jgi:HEAT repeat protein